MEIPTYFSEPVCVAIAADEIADEEVKERLGAAWPLRVTHWTQRSYLAAIRQLRPSLILIVTVEQEPIEELALLLSALFERSAPTIASVVLPTPATSTRLRLTPIIIWYLGHSATLRIRSLRDMVIHPARP